MLKLLLKKQLTEIFKSYFFDAKKNRMRPKWQIAAWFVFFVLIVAGMLGGIFTMLSLSLCEPMLALDLGWMYYLIMSIVAIVLGAFGSVFNTYSVLYLAKDNDQLLSLPIPVRTIMASRLATVYLLGAIYSAVVMIPAMIVYCVKAGFSAAHLAGGIMLLVLVTVIVLLLSCILGWCVAKISLKLKNKSFITVLLSLLFLGAYYYFYFQANGLIQQLLLNAVYFGEKIKGAAYGLYLFGTIGEGSLTAALIFTSFTVLACTIVFAVMSHTFLSIAASGETSEKVRYVEKTAKQRTAFGALLGKEFRRFTSSANYMLNTGLGILFIPAVGIAILLKGREILTVLDAVFQTVPDASAVLFCGSLMLLSSMNDMCVPSVSLEGKSLWIPQSLPVETKTVLRAKVSVQLILTAIPMLFASVCAVFILNASLIIKALMILLPLAYTVFSALTGMYFGIKMPMLQWTNETAPVKQSGAVSLILFGSWLLSAVFIGVYLLFAYQYGSLLYLILWTAVLAAASAFLLHWMDTEGCRRFTEL
ncbi:MAG: hypothetical protein K6A40_10140 [Solobacterium sp.]|nr:hypothetical protein [Solobacterium sp.]